jgi:hypothetical protein
MEGKSLGLTGGDSSNDFTINKFELASASAGSLTAKPKRF